jgi:hypoxanthine phosphoribosyltransferase
MADKWHLTWGEYEAMVRQMTARLELLCHPGHIRAIPRGGLIPAVMACHELDIPYHGDFPVDGAADPLNKHSILIDDILDTGETLINILKSTTPHRPVPT